jgi:hypothetical protein
MARLLDVIGYAAGNGYGAEVWPVAFTCRTEYVGDGSERSDMLLEPVASRRARVVHPPVPGELRLRTHLSHAARTGNVLRLRMLMRVNPDSSVADRVGALWEATHGGHVECVAPY